MAALAEARCTAVLTVQGSVPVVCPEFLSEEDLRFGTHCTAHRASGFPMDLVDDARALMLTVMGEIYTEKRSELGSWSDVEETFARCAAAAIMISDERVNRQRWVISTRARDYALHQAYARIGDHVVAQTAELDDLRRRGKWINGAKKRLYLIGLVRAQDLVKDLYLRS